MAIWISSRDVENCINEKNLIKAIRQGFRELDHNKVEPKRIKVDLAAINKTTENAEVMLLVPGFIEKIPAFTIKVHTKYPENPARGLPSIQGVIQLYDVKKGKLLAIIDSPLLTAHRTAAAGAIAADILARKNAAAVAIIGAGFQGEMQLKYLQHVRKIEEVKVFDLRPTVASEFADCWRSEELVCTVASNLKQALQNVDMVICSTWAKEPFIFRDLIEAGTHITTVGADTAGKVEVSADVIQDSLFVCDDKEMALTMGALNTFETTIKPKSFSTLTDILNGKAYGRRNDDELTVFGGVGLPFQDLIAAWEIYHTAITLGIGQKLN